MSNPILDLLGDVGYAMDTPGAYLRGALAGKVGERASGEDMLNSWGVDAGPLGGMAAEVVADPLAIAGLAGGAYKAARGIQGATNAARGMVASDDAIRAGLTLRSGVEDGTAFSRLFRGDDMVGYANAGATRGGAEGSAAGTLFPGVVPEGAPVARFRDIFFDGTRMGDVSGTPYHGKGLGQQMMLDAMAQSPVEWFYNSQSSPAAAAVHDRLAAKGLINQTWDTGLRGVPNVGGPYVMSLTDAGRAMAGTGGLVHPGVLAGDPATKPMNPVVKAIARFVGGETAAFQPFREIGRRTDPDFVNSVPWYHGTGTPGLTPQSLDPMLTDADGLFGRGIYKTANPEVASEYAATRASEGITDWQRKVSGSTVKATQADPVLASGVDDALRGLFARQDFMADRPDLKNYIMANIGGARKQPPGRVTRAVMTNLAGDPPALRQVSDELSRLGIKTPPMPTETVYEAGTNYGKILDLDQAADPGLVGGMMDYAKSIEGMVNPELDDPLDIMYGLSNDAAAGKLLNSDLIGNMKPSRFESLPAGTPDPLIAHLRGQGYDALTHTGGLRAGGGRSLHDVLIGLDPNDTISKVGRAGQITRFEPQQIEDLLRQMRGG